VTTAKSVNDKSTSVNLAVYQWSFRKLTTMGTPKLSAEGAKFEAPKAPSIERVSSAEG